MSQLPEAAPTRSWYRIQAKTEPNQPTSIEVLIYDEIGLWGISAARFIDELKAMDDGRAQITIAINSPGGDVFDGFAIHNALLRLGERCTVRIDGLAASAASVIACGGHHVVMAANAMLMIHNPWTFTYGTAQDLRKTADMMDKARDGILAAYRRKAPAIEDAALIQMLDEETWLNADEALALGLVDLIGEAVALQACRGSTNVLARFKHPPDALLSASAEVAPAPVTESEAATEPSPDPTPDTARLARNVARFTQACLVCGLSDLTEELLMNTPLTDDDAVAAQIERLQAIRTLCASARRPELAADYVRSGLSVEAVRARLFEQLLAAQGAPIDNKEPPVSTEAPLVPSPNTSAIYAARKKTSRRPATVKKVPLQVAAPQ
ncbi:head maturation protease, ClpP-related [Enterobacter roggenkampii]|uniref:head maturation protease, ClpP-related n=1 Tax=Enterobacter roggenkampii TaxID=1812935 RepID=UPI0015EA2BCF|nr:head maturation protease, ClpP-related [Enterobacter roggenkampii]QLS00492.1 Clp protease ClpP [Enterobacter roggenkampii]